jgi:hypothetical protein
MPSDNRDSDCYFCVVPSTVCCTSLFGPLACSVAARLFMVTAVDNIVLVLLSHAHPSFVHRRTDYVVLPTLELEDLLLAMPKVNQRT